MKILYVTYSCSPYNGSEDKIGWSIPWAMKDIASNVYVVTKIEQKPFIDKFLSTLTPPQPKNLHFVYVDIPSIYKIIYKGPFYSGRQNIWLKKVSSIVKRYVNNNDIDIIHQITPVEFRSVGYFGNLNAKYIIGPIGGGEYAPKPIEKRYFKNHIFLENIRRYENKIIRNRLRKKHILQNSDWVYLVNEETKRFLSPCLIPKNCSQLIDIGIDDNEIINEYELKSKINKKTYTVMFLVSGRLVYRKGHAFLFHALSLLPKQLNYHVLILGDGPERKNLVNLTIKLNLQNHITFLGKLPFVNAQKIYEKADILIVPSLRETTGSIFTEALAKGVPVITSNMFGGNEVINEKNGWKYDLAATNPEKSLANIIEHCIQNPAEVKEKSIGALHSAEKYSWKRKAFIFDKLYKMLLKS